MFTWNIHFVRAVNVFTVNYSGNVIALDYKYADSKLSDTSSNIPPGAEFIRRTLNVGNEFTSLSQDATLAYDHDFEEMPLCKQSPLRGELEMEAYGRQYFLNLNAYVQGGGTVWSLPYLSFIDGFGAFWSMYRTIIGIYHPLCCLTAQERERCANVFPLTLSPHGSNLAEVIAVFKQLTELDAGVDVLVNGQPV